MARRFESRDRDRPHHLAGASTTGDRHPAAFLLQMQRDAGNQAVTGALQRQVFKPRPAKKDKPAPEPSKKDKPAPKSKQRLDWQKMVVAPLAQALKLAKKGPRQFNSAANVIERVGDAVAEFHNRTLDGQIPENGTVFQLLRLVHSLFWELRFDPHKGGKPHSSYSSDFPGDLVDRATWIEDELKKRVAAKPDDSHLLGAWTENYSQEARQIVAKIKASGEPKTGTDSQILINSLENMRGIAALIRGLVKDDPKLQTHLAATIATVTEHIVTTEQNMTGPNDVDTVTTHPNLAKDIADELSSALSTVH